MKDIIEKVNYYSRLSKQRELTEEEKKEREHYRNLYMQQFKDQVRGHLENIEIIDENKVN